MRGTPLAGEGSTTRAQRRTASLYPNAIKVPALGLRLRNATGLLTTDNAERYEMRYQAMIALAVAGLAAPAYAQDMSGFRVEGRAGWERLGVSTQIPNPDDDEDEDGDEFLVASRNDSGISYGGEIGYDLQVGSGFVLGAYVGADMSDGRTCAELIEDDLACVRLRRTFAVGARAGVPLGRSALAYVKGGYSNGKFRTTYDDDVTDNDDDEPGEILGFSKTRGGYHVGGGLELGLMRGVYAKLEYLYTDFGSRTYLLGDEAGDPELKVGSDRHQVLAGFGVRF